MTQEKWSRQASLSAINALNLKGNNLRVAQYWLSLWSKDRPPKRSSFNPTGLRDLLLGIAVFDVRPGESVHCRQAGTVYALRFGFDIARKNWLELTPREHRGVRLERNSVIVTGAISKGLRLDPNRNDASRWFADVQLPFSAVNEDGSVSYLHHTEWRPKGDEFLLYRPRIGEPTPAEQFTAIAIRDEGRG
jgi:hypothetical protein